MINIIIVVLLNAEEISQISHILLTIDFLQSQLTDSAITIKGEKTTNWQANFYQQINGTLYDCLNYCFNVEPVNCSLFATDFSGSCYLGNFLNDTPKDSARWNMSEANTVILQKGTYLQLVW